jgi:hypothetical protein
MPTQRRGKVQRHGAAYKVTGTRSQDPTGHHQRTQATDLYDQESTDDRRASNERWLREMMGRYGPGPEGRY